MSVLVWADVGTNEEKGNDIMKREIIIQKEATVNANGNTYSRHTKPVICLTTGETYTSCQDAAEANGVHFSSMSLHCSGKSKTCNGKRYCYVVDLPNHLEELSMTLQKCSGYLAEMEEKERRAKEEEKFRLEALKAEEKRQKELAKEEERKQKAIAKAEKNIARREEKLNSVKEKYFSIVSELNQAEEDVLSAKKEFKELTETSVATQVAQAIADVEAQMEMAMQPESEVNMKTLTLHKYGKEHPMTFELNRYAENGNLYVGLITHEEGYPAPWQNLTVNLSVKCNDGCAFIDTNNNGDEIIDWLIEHELGILTGKERASGWCVYPEFMFFMDKLREFTNEWDNDYDDEPYIPSCTNRDYSPSNPWDAPGMSIRDFI